MNTKTWTAVTISAFLLMSTNASALYNLNNFVPNYGGLKIDPGGTTPVYPSSPEPVPPPTSEPEEVPIAPDLWVDVKTTHSITFKFEDKSDVEAGFRLYRRQSGEDWIEIGRFDPIANRTAELYIWDGQEEGFKMSGTGQNAPVEILPADQSSSSTTLSRFSPLSVWQEDLEDISQNTRYCYRLVPYDSQGREPDRVPTVCTTTNRDLKAVVKRDQIARNNISVNATAYDIAVLVSDRSGLVGELNSEWNGRKLVYVDNRAIIDLTFLDTLVLKEGLTLMSGRDKLSEGALLFNNSFHKEWVFEITGNNVQVVGLRFRGPSGSNDKNLPKVEAIRARIHNIGNLKPDNPLSILISGNEFYHWTRAGVFLRNKVSSLYLHKGTADRVRVTKNWFHHNQRQNEGYGVAISDFVYAYIDKNTFDYNRHAIASNLGGRNTIRDEDYGPQQHGYMAYLNLVLPGHTNQCYWDQCWRETHHFDVHGTDSGSGFWIWDEGGDYLKYGGLGLGNPNLYGLGEVLNSTGNSLHYDGWAGEYFEVKGNSFLGIDGEGDAFNIRGTPRISAIFRGNVLPMEGETWDYVNEESDDDDRIVVRGNKHYSDARKYLGVGDFDGDGIDDIFMATGAAWYYSSGGKTEWRYLNKSSHRIDDLVLVDYDGDGKTDVLRERLDQWVVSKGGVTPWRTDYRNNKDYSNDRDYSNIQPNNGTSVTGDFTGDGNLDQLEFKWEGDRYFYVNGVKHSRYEM